MKNALKGLAELQSTMLVTDTNRDKIILAMSEIKRLQAQNAQRAKKIEELISFTDSLQLSVGDDARLCELIEHNRG